MDSFTKMGLGVLCFFIGVTLVALGGAINLDWLSLLGGTMVFIGAICAVVYGKKWLA